MGPAAHGQEDTSVSRRHMSALGALCCWIAMTTMLLMRFSRARNTSSATEDRVKQLPSIENSLLLRTDFSDDAAWASLCEAVQQPHEDGFKAYVACINDPAYDGLTVEQLMALAPKGDQCGQHSFAFVADRMTFANPERPVLVVDLYDEPGR